MVRPFVIHKFMERRAWIFAALTAEIDISISGALPESALLDMIIYSLALTAIAVRRAAGTAIKAARPVLGWFHDQTLFMATDLPVFLSWDLKGFSTSW